MTRIRTNFIKIIFTQCIIKWLYPVGSRQLALVAIHLFIVLSLCHRPASTAGAAAPCCVGHVKWSRQARARVESARARTRGVAAGPPPRYEQRHSPVPVLAGCTRWACTRRSPSAASESAAPSSSEPASDATPYSPQSPASPPRTAPPAAWNDAATKSLARPTMKSSHQLGCSTSEWCSLCSASS